MKIPAVLAALLLVVVSCAQLLGRSEAPASAESVDAGVCACTCPAVGAELREVQVERDRCEAALRDAGTPEVRTRTVERVVQAPPKRCGGAGPDLVPVHTTRCQKGMVCLDTAAQAALASNELAWRTWLRRVQDCEDGQ